MWRKEPLDESFRKVLLDYANDLSKLFKVFSIRFEEPRIDSAFEELQIIKAIGYRPKECIVVCGFFHQSFYAIEEILRKFGGYLNAGAPEDVINTINGKAHKIIKAAELDYDYDGTIEIVERSYRLLDADFIMNYYNVRRDRAVLRMFSLDEYKVDGLTIKDITRRIPIN